ncbi:zinc-dependent metalloprotease [Crocinitomix algicola]|uniref:zinc-dependent metalloprotease n=1 Tax=Crocinitomix algicola TaxID=1740263 RepID=UPI000836B053|nr:zinc-dependent metalloprotease [Crocinitomix algicola]
MKQIIAAIGLLATTYSVQAQTEHWCGTDHYMEELYKTQPELETSMHEHLLRLRTEGTSYSDREDDFIIPVVVHILHDNGEGNISYEQVQSGIDMLNEDFNRENSDADETRDTEEAPFLSSAADMGIRFELAKIDPDGNCTNGIQRRNVGSLSYNSNNRQKHYSTGGLDAWNRNYYMNIWIVNSIESEGGVTLGYAEFPYSGGSSNYGVIIRHDAYGDVGTASGDRTLTHEIGHCLGLLHTFQGGCHMGSCSSNGDYCCDTPPVVSAQWSCDTEQNTCDEIPSGDPYGFDAKDQFENFMSYSPCQNMYSNDQKDIVINNLNTIGFLENLVDPDHHVLTGVGTPAVLCKADFYADRQLICAGDEIEFIDASFDNVTGYSWNFEGGSPSISTEANPTITFDAPGTYDVTLEVTDGIDTRTVTFEDYITVMNVPGTGLPYSEGFETLASFPDYDRFSIIDEDLDEAWEINDEVAYTGNRSIWLKNRGVNNNSYDSFISGTIDLSDVDEEDDMIFSFKYAYKRRNASTDEWLRFYISNNCGESWVLRKNIHGDDLGPEIQNGSYTPESNDEWFEVVIENISSSFYTENFRYKIEFQNDNGNNIYIDDINLYPVSMLSIEEHKSYVSAIYPNPGSDIVNLALTATAYQNLQVEVLNTLGQPVFTIYEGEINTGSYNFDFNVSHLPGGMYYIRIKDNSGYTLKKFIKE